MFQRTICLFASSSTRVVRRRQGHSCSTQHRRWAKSPAGTRVNSLVAKQPGLTGLKGMHARQTSE
jgi:hypothetical protein